MTTDSNGTNLLYRVEALERGLNEKVPNNEYHLQMQVVKDTYTRVEDSLSKLAIQVGMIQDRLADQELKAEQRANTQQQAISDLKVEQQKSISGLQSKMLYGLLSLIGTVVAGYLIWYFTHPY